MKTGRIIVKTATTVVVVAAVLLSLLLVGVRLFGLQVYTVLSGSMEPAYPTGSLIYVRSIDPAKLQVGDVITFSLSEQTTATHRIIEILSDDTHPDALRFRTKGDANEFEDGDAVLQTNVIGTPVFHIPCLGYVAAFIQQPPGMYVAFAIGLILVIFVFIADTWLGDKLSKTGDASPEEAENTTDIKETEI